MDLDRMSPCSLKAFNRKSGFATSGTWAFDRVPKGNVFVAGLNVILHRPE